MQHYALLLVLMPVLTGRITRRCTNQSAQSRLSVGFRDINWAARKWLSYCRGKHSYILHIITLGTNKASRSGCPRAGGGQPHISFSGRVYRLAQRHRARSSSLVWEPSWQWVCCTEPWEWCVELESPSQLSVVGKVCCWVLCSRPVLNEHLYISYLPACSHIWYW